MKTQLNILWVIFCLGLCLGIQAQTSEGENPFELTPRLKELPEKERSADKTEENVNPFELVTPTEKKTTITIPQIKTEVDQQKKSFGGQSFLLGIILFGLVLMAVLITTLRPFFAKSYRAILNENMLNQIYREREAGVFFPYFILYLMFFVNAGIFLFLILKYTGISFAPTPFLLVIGCIFLIAFLFFLKHLLLAVVGSIFPISKETRIYSFTIMVYSIMLGLVLAPINLMIASASEQLVLIIIIGSLILIVSLYIIRAFRGLLLANDYLRFHIFHFLLYICTVEIAPVLVLYKLIINQL